MPITKSPHVWIVDDDEDDQYLFAVAFQHFIPPIIVKQLGDGEDLLPALAHAECLPDLVILDLNMPRLNGFETLKLLRAGSAYQHLPVVVLSTSAQPQEKERALQLGANGFLTKPASLDSILNLFGQLVQEWQLH